MIVKEKNLSFHKYIYTIACNKINFFTNKIFFYFMPQVDFHSSKATVGALSLP